MGWKIHEMDVKTTLLNGFNKEEVYIEKPTRFKTFDRQSHVCRLKWELYGLKQAPRAWYISNIDNYITNLGFTKREADAKIYHILVEGKILVISLYVDDLILTIDEHLIRSCKEDIEREFEMKDMVSCTSSSYWKYGKVIMNFSSLRESMPMRYFRGFSWTVANPWTRF